MKDKQFYVGQKAIISKNSRVLILHDPILDALDLPGGKIQEGEADFSDSLKREVSEEIGLKIEIIKPISTGYFQVPKNSGHRSAGKEIFMVYYKCLYKRGKIKLSDEHDWYKWADKKNYQKLFTSQTNIKNVLDVYFK